MTIHDKNIDWASQPSVTIKDFYHIETGKHLRTVIELENGEVIEESGPNPAKDLHWGFPWKLPWEDKK